MTDPAIPTTRLIVRTPGAVVVDQQVGEDDFKHALWVLEADAIGKGPIAKVALPFRLRQQVHGWWVPQAALEAAK